MSENRLNSREETLARSPVNINGDFQENTENFDPDQLQTQQNLDENCSDSIHSPLEEHGDEYNEPENRIPIENNMENQRIKKYSEFLGKRFSEFLGKRGLLKRYSEFIGKRLHHGKRFSEFLGKRSRDKNNSEYLGKGDHITKRYWEFLGKRHSKGKRYSDFLMGKRYSDFLMGKRHHLYNKRQGEWLGK